MLSKTKEQLQMSEELKALIRKSRNSFPTSAPERNTLAFEQEIKEEKPPEKEVVYVPELTEPPQWCDKAGWMDFPPFHK